MARRIRLLAPAFAAAALLILGYGFAPGRASAGAPAPTPLVVRHDAEAGTISVFRAGEGRALLTHIARADFRPYLHPVVAPDGRGVFTELSPEHHRHQTGLNWGFTRLKGRDYFHNPGGSHWRRVSVNVVEAQGPVVVWQTVYDLLGESGGPVLRETQIWSMREEEDRYLLDLEWRGEAKTAITVGEYDYGGLFLRMPWRSGIEGGVLNAARQGDEAAEGKRAMWLDVGMKVEGRDDQARVAIFDHPGNAGYPQPWRVDGQLGVGPARARLGDTCGRPTRCRCPRHEPPFRPAARCRRDGVRTPIPAPDPPVQPGCRSAPEPWPRSTLSF